mmetsp:Transcript_15404/g.42292  ORF Transcript_15404/g.42292 Transcript_15404/m.42292 type:complete len:219 (+) Transcript_15404:305-961(+)
MSSSSESSGTRCSREHLTKMAIKSLNSIKLLACPPSLASFAMSAFEGYKPSARTTLPNSSQVMAPLPPSSKRSNISRYDLIWSAFHSFAASSASGLIFARLLCSGGPFILMYFPIALKNARLSISLDPVVSNSVTIFCMSKVVGEKPMAFMQCLSATAPIKPVPDEWYKSNMSLYAKTTLSVHPSTLGSSCSLLASNRCRASGSLHVLSFIHIETHPT